MLSIGAIVKNEMPYFMEWLAWHQLVGVEKFYIADNISDDGTSELLIDLHNKGIITRIEYPTTAGTAPQAYAYSELLSLAHNVCEYMALIDIDEYFLFSESENNISELLALFDDISVGGIAVNWSVFGSSGNILPAEGLVIERFDHRAEQSHQLNQHYKSIIRLKAYAGPGGGGIHHFRLKEGFQYVQTDGKPLRTNTGISQKVCWDICRLNHYVIKSVSEFYTKKIPRGRAGGNEHELNSFFFEHHDLNTVRDNLPYKLIAKVKNRIKKMTFGNHYPSNTLFKSDSYHGRGYIDIVQYDENTISFTGWVEIDSRFCNIILVLNHRNVAKKVSLVRHSRMDVITLGLSTHNECGFVLSFEKRSILISKIFSLNLYAIDKNNDVCFEFDLREHHAVLSGIFKTLVVT